MADLAASAVSLAGGATNLAGDEAYENKGRALFSRRLKIALSGQGLGTATHMIPAAALGFKKLVDCGSLYDVSNSKVIPAAVDPVNNAIVLGAGASNALADVTSATTYITVLGT